jgi:hypothetical protein
VLREKPPKSTQKHPKIEKKGKKWEKMLKVNLTFI